MPLAFYRQSLQIQQYLAELFHNAYALRGIDGPEDVQNIYPFQKQLALDSLTIAQQTLNIFVNSSSYREGLKYGKSQKHIRLSSTGTNSILFSGPLHACYSNICRVIPFAIR